jgi:hypothetical protein
MCRGGPAGASCTGALLDAKRLTAQARSGAPRRALQAHAAQPLAASAAGAAAGPALEGGGGGGACAAAAASPMAAGVETMWG